MKIKAAFWTVFLAGVLALSFIGLHGCTTPNPAYTPVAAGQPDTNTVPRVIPNPMINSVSNAVSGVAAVVSPLNPYAGLTSWAVTAVFGIVGGISTWIARQKSGALAGMAQAVVQSGAHAAVLDASGNHPQFSTIATAINDAVPATGTLTGTAPPKV